MLTFLLRDDAIPRPLRGGRSRARWPAIRRRATRTRRRLADDVLRFLDRSR